MPGIIVKPRSRILQGHDWVFQSEVLKVYGNPPDGSVISIKDGKDKLLGSAIYNSQSQIVARRFSRSKDALDREFFERRIARARTLRERRKCNPDFHRLVWSESDGLPGLIVDRYDHIMVFQTLTLAMDLNKEMIAELLLAIPGVDAVIERNSSSARAAENLPLQSGVVMGETDGRVVLVNGDSRYQLDLLSGHKTGYYLDQMDNHRRVAQYAQGRRVLDCFSNQGAFAIASARQGAVAVLALESSADCCLKIRENARLNEVEVAVEEEDVFGWLPNAVRRGTEYDLIVLDPPSFTKGKGGIHAALRGYRELHLRAAKLLSKNGILATFSCSHHITASDFLESVREGFNDSRRSAHLAETLSQSSDHPVLLAMPETEYLKGFVFEMIG
ncbi:MAG: class I SAM-dependent rRNA methyltransferase [Chthoniobacterales bacterium]